MKDEKKSHPTLFNLGILCCGTRALLSTPICNIAENLPQLVERLSLAEEEVRKVLLGRSPEARRLKPIAIEGRKVINALYAFVEDPLAPGRAKDLKQAVLNQELFIYENL